MEKFISMDKLFLKVMNNTIFFLLFLFLPFSVIAESTVKASDSLVWDSQNKSYTATGNVEFTNNRFIAFSDKMIAKYIEQNNKEVFTVVELFENVKIEYNDEIFKGDYAIYTKKNNIIRLIGNVSIKSPTRLLTGYELIADIDNNKRTLNSENDDALVEVLLENNADN